MLYSTVNPHFKTDILKMYFLSPRRVTSLFITPDNSLHPWGMWSDMLKYENKMN